ncbi:MAG: hypothetical protein FWG82_01990 [Oscillospiraceae bacterium]|nr:hypothetical protein [Oscillospiraceae bacterium]
MNSRTKTLCAMLLCVAAVFVFFACNGGSPADLEITTGVADGATVFSDDYTPADASNDGYTSTQEDGTVPVNAGGSTTKTSDSTESGAIIDVQAESTNTTRPAAAQSTSTSPATTRSNAAPAQSTSEKSAASTRSAQSTTSTRVNNTASTRPPATTTTSAAPKPATLSIDINLAKIQGLGLASHTYKITTTDSINRVKTRDFTGVRVRDVLAALGADMSRITKNSTLHAIANDGVSYTYPYGEFMDDRALFSWQEDNTVFDTVRISPGGTTGQNAFKFVKDAAKITLMY